MLAKIWCNGSKQSFKLLNSSRFMPLCDDLQPYAKQISDQVSAAMLAKVACNEGRWQDIAAPCPEEQKSQGDHGRAENIMHSVSLGVAAGITRCLPTPYHII